MEITADIEVEQMISPANYFMTKGVILWRHAEDKDGRLTLPPIQLGPNNELRVLVASEELWEPVVVSSGPKGIVAFVTNPECKNWTFAVIKSQTRNFTQNKGAITIQLFDSISVEEYLEWRELYRDIVADCKRWHVEGKDGEEFPDPDEDVDTRWEWAPKVGRGDGNGFKRILALFAHSDDETHLGYYEFRELYPDDDEDEVELTEQEMNDMAQDSAQEAIREVVQESQVREVNNGG